MFLWHLDTRGGSKHGSTLRWPDSRELFQGFRTEPGESLKVIFSLPGCFLLFRLFLFWALI